MSILRFEDIFNTRYTYWYIPNFHDFSNDNIYSRNASFHYIYMFKDQELHINFGCMFCSIGSVQMLTYNLIFI
jgi:hypothetical protein